MRQWIVTVQNLLREPVTRTALAFLGLFALLRILHSQKGAKFVTAAVIFWILVCIFQEWLKYIPAFRRALGKRVMRVMKALRPFSKIPPAVPVLYGVAAMYLLGELSLVLLGWVSPQFSTIDLFIVGILGLLGAFLHTYSLIIKIARWSWSKVLGKILYIVLTTVCIAIGHADAVRVTRHLVHADAKYFLSFLGLLSSWYACVTFVLAATILMSVCGLFLFVMNVIPAFLRGIYRPWVPKGTTHPLLDRWRRMRFNGNVDAEIAARGGHLRDFINFFTPIALMSVAPVLALVPAAIMTAPLTQSILAGMVFTMEYTADNGCPNVPGNQPTVHLDGDFVSVAAFVNGNLTTTRQTCHIAPTSKISGESY